MSTAAAITVGDHHDIRALHGAEGRLEEVNVFSHLYPSVRVDKTCGPIRYEINGELSEDNDGGVWPIFNTPTPAHLTSFVL